MPNFFKSFFAGKTENPEEEKQKNAKKNFEIFKYDGLRAQRMGRPDYAIKCFNEALAIEEDFETLNYLSQLYIQTGEFGKAHELLERMIALEPELTSTYLTLAISASCKKIIRRWPMPPRKPSHWKNETQWHTTCWAKPIMDWITE